MMKYLFLFTLVGLTFCSSIAQSTSYIQYYLLVDSADYLKKSQQYEKAISIYEGAFVNNQARNNDLLSLTECYLKINQPYKAYSYTKKSICKGTPLRYFNRLRASANNSSDSTIFWNLLEKNYLSLRRTFYNNIDIDNYLTLSLIKREDQNIREYLAIHDPSLQNEDLVRYIRAVDSTNIYRLLDLIDLTGKWPGALSYGDAESGSYYVLLHLSEATFQNKNEYDRIYSRLYEVAKKGVQSGELTPFQFAYWIDYQSKTQDGKQTYGVPSFKHWKDIPFKDISRVDEYRREIGLPPLHIEFSRNNIDLPDQYHLGNE